MFSKNRSESTNSFNKATRPGTLLALLLIGLGIVYLLSSRSGEDGALADGAEGEIYAEVEEAAEEDVLDDEVLEDEDVLGDVQDDEVLEDEAVEGDEVLEDEVLDGESIENEVEDDEVLGEEIIEGEVLDDEVMEEEVVEGDVRDDEVLDEEVLEDDDADEGRHRECIYVPAIGGFHVIDDKHLTVSTSPRRIYLLTLLNRCRQLNWTHKIAIKSYSNWTCSYSKDTIIANDDRCMIDDIERVDSVEEAEAIVEERTSDE